MISFYSRDTACRADRPAGRENSPQPRSARLTVEAVTTAQQATIPAGLPLADTTVDLLVVGSGTGMAAALAAAERGLTVLIVEKSQYVGGSTARSGGALWFPASPVLEENGAGDTATKARDYLDSVVAATAAPQRSTEFLGHLSETVQMLRRTTPMRFTWARDYSDYHPEHPGGSAAGRTCECKPFNTSVLGPYRSRLRPGLMEPTVPMPIRVDPEAVEDHEHAVLVARAAARRCRASPCSGPVERRGADFDGADLRVVRAGCRRPRCRSAACASEQEVWPSAASGLIVRPSGRVRVADAQRSTARALAREELLGASAGCRARRARRLRRWSGRRCRPGRTSGFRSRSSPGSWTRHGGLSGSW